jgi:hypothetical protein
VHAFLKNWTALRDGKQQLSITAVLGFERLAREFMGSVFPKFDVPVQCASERFAFSRRQL